MGAPGMSHSWPLPLRTQTLAHRRTGGMLRAEGRSLQGQGTRKTLQTYFCGYCKGSGYSGPCFFRSVSEGYHEGIHKALEVVAGGRPGSSLQDVSLCKQPTGSLNSVISAEKTPAWNSWEDGGWSLASSSSSPTPFLCFGLPCASPFKGEVTMPLCPRHRQKQP